MIKSLNHQRYEMEGIVKQINEWKTIKKYRIQYKVSWVEEGFPR